MGTRFMATKECPISDRYKQALVTAQPWDPEYRDRAILPPRHEEYQRVMREKDSLPTDQWLQKLEEAFHQETADTTPIDWEKAYQEWEPEAALRLGGGSLAVGVIDEVVTVKELIDSIIVEAGEILPRAGGMS